MAHDDNKKAPSSLPNSPHPPQLPPRRRRRRIRKKKKKKKKPHPNNTPQQLQLRTLQINSFISVGGGNEPRIHEEVLGGSAAIEDVDLLPERGGEGLSEERRERGGRRKKFIIVLRGRMKVV